LNKENNYLLPNKFKWLSLGLIISGFIFGVIRFYYGIKLEVFDITVFAIYSSFFETKYLTFIQNNFGEEISGLLLLLGIFLLVVSKEKNEFPEIMKLRLRAFFLSLYTNTILLILSFLFVFGFGFINVMIASMYSIMIIYYIIFNYYLFKYNRSTEQ